MLSNWDEITLQDILSISTTKVDSENISLDSYISTDNMLPDFGGVINAEKMPSVRKVTAYAEGDILFSNIRTYFKKLWFADKSGGCSNDVIVFKVRKGVCPKFAFYSLMSESFIQYTVQTSKGTKMPRGDKVAMKQYSLLLPPLPEQNAIAHILGTLDDKIELNRQMNETLEAMAQALFKSWFVDFDPVIDNALLAGNDIPEPLKERAEMRQAQLDSGKAKTNSEIKNLFPSEFEFTEELGWIPKGWSVKTISDVTSEIIDHRGKTPKKLGGDWVENGYPAISAKNIKDNKLVRRDTIRYIDEDMYKRWMKIPLEKGDVLMTSEAPLGELYYLNSEKKYVLSQRLYGIRANNKDCSGAYLFYWLQTNTGSASLQNRATGTTVIGIKQSELRKVEVLCPTGAILEKFNSYSLGILEKMDANDSSNITLAKLRDTLLPKLMLGELRIPDAEKLVEDI